MNAPRIKGWCPGLLRPMASGDGLIIRVKPLAGRLDLFQAQGLGELSRRFGNGQMDVTQRGNLQIRGCRAADLPAIQRICGELGLIDANEAAEAARNLIASPLAGEDPAARADIAPLLKEFSAHLVADPVFARLPGKFCWLIDGAGLVDLSGIAADIRFLALGENPKSEARFRLDLGAPSGWQSAGLVPAGAINATASRLAAAFLAQDAAPGRMARLPEKARRELVAALGLPPAPPMRRRRPRPRIGPLRDRGRDWALSLGMAFGRLDAAMLAGLAAALAAKGIGHLYLSPLRALVIPLPKAEAHLAARLAADLVGAGFILDPDDPRLGILACPGKGACAEAFTDTRLDAARLAAFLGADRSSEKAPPLIHLSGCAKGCAHPKAAPITLIGQEGGLYGLVRQGRADGVPEALIPAGALTRTGWLGELGHG